MTDNPKLFEQGDTFAGRDSMGYGIKAPGWISTEITLRDLFAALVQEDDRLVRCVRAMDDKALEFFALYPHAEREEHITETEYTEWDAIPTAVGKVTKRLELEARAIARVRYMQADAMLQARGTSALPRNC